VSNGKIAFTVKQTVGSVTDNQIFVMNPDGSAQTPLTIQGGADPAYSADGTRIAFSSGRDTSDGRAQIYVMNADGSNQVRLTNDSNDEQTPSWSPDGAKIVFTAYPSSSTGFLDPRAEIYVINANGSNQTRLTNNTDYDDFASYSPDGAKIVFHSNRSGLLHIYVMNADGSTQTQLSTSIPGNPDEGTPAWSPDGTKIAHARGDLTNLSSLELYVMNANGSNPVALTMDAYPEVIPVWSPDGTKLAFPGFPTDPTLETGAIYSMNADGSNQVRLTDFNTEGGRVSWAPGPPAAIQFSAANYNVGEGGVAATITVTRSGDTTGASTVDFLSSDGSATQAQDYEVASGTVSFAAGETSKTFSVLIVDDAFVEANETLNLTLSNPVGAVLAAPSTATVTITDNDTVGSISPAPKRFAASLDGLQETPANNSLAKGTGLVLLNSAETSALVGLQFQNLGSAETAAHVHGPTGPGVAAPVLFPLASTNPLTNFSISPIAQQVADLKAGLHYLNVHSLNFSGGEIRGQLLWNPTLEENFFVRQQYLDFLSRDGDPGGFNFWVGTITPCQADAQCFHDRSIAAADAFFFEPEFQQTAGFVFRAYRAAFGNSQPFPNPDNSNPTEANKLVDYSTFVADRARVVGGTDLAAAQQAFANLFVSRSAFTTKYAAATTGPLFVDAILATIQSADGVDLSAQRQTLIDQFNLGGRGMVLYRLADDNPQNPITNQAFINAEYNRQFALTLYFGYLRRNPEIGGFLFWQSQINLAAVRDVPKQNALVCSFITAAEYQGRFGVNAPRTNAECPQ
jgi:Tol biopolymer transport system component